MPWYVRMNVPECVPLFVQQSAPTPAGRKTGTLGGELKLAVRECGNRKAHEGMTEKKPVELVGLEEVRGILRKDWRTREDARELEAPEKGIGVEISPGLDDWRHPPVAGGGRFHLVVGEAFAHGVMLESVERSPHESVELPGIEKTLVIAGRVRNVRHAKAKRMLRERKGV